MACIFKNKCFFSPSTENGFWGASQIDLPFAPSVGWLPEAHMIPDVLSDNEPWSFVSISGMYEPMIYSTRKEKYKAWLKNKRQNYWQKTIVKDT